MNDEFVVADMTGAVEHPILHAELGASLLCQRAQLFSRRLVPRVVNRPAILFGFGAAGIRQDEIELIEVRAKQIDEFFVLKLIKRSMKVSVRLGEKIPDDGNDVARKIITEPVVGLLQMPLQLAFFYLAVFFENPAKELSGENSVRECRDERRTRAGYVDDVGMRGLGEIAERNRLAFVGVLNDVSGAAVTVALRFDLEPDEPFLPSPHRLNAVAHTVVVGPSFRLVPLLAQSEIAPVEFLHRPDRCVLREPIGIALTLERDIGGKRPLIGDLVVCVQIFANDVKPEASGDFGIVDLPGEISDFVVRKRPRSNDFRHLVLPLQVE